MAIRHAKMSKNIGRGEGAYDSPRPILMVFTPPNTLACNHRASNFISCEHTRLRRSTAAANGNNIVVRDKLARLVRSLAF